MDSGLHTPRPDVVSARAFVEGLFARHRAAVQAYFRRRLRTKSDADDLAQEVYLRLLRVNDTAAIRNPEAYLYTIAGNLLKEHALIARRTASGTDDDAVASLPAPEEFAAHDAPLDARRRLDRLRIVLRQLPPKCRAAVVLQYRYDLSYQQIAERLEVSPHMVKKYLWQALAHCRRRMVRLG